MAFCDSQLLGSSAETICHTSLGKTSLAKCTSYLCGGPLGCPFGCFQDALADLWWRLKSMLRDSPPTPPPWPKSQVKTSLESKIYLDAGWLERGTQNIPNIKSSGRFHVRFSADKAFQQASGVCGSLWTTSKLSLLLMHETKSHSSRKTLWSACYRPFRFTKLQGTCCLAYACNECTTQGDEDTPMHVVYLLWYRCRVCLPIGGNLNELTTSGCQLAFTGMRTISTLTIVHVYFPVTYLDVRCSSLQCWKQMVYKGFPFAKPSLSCIRKAVLGLASIVFAGGELSVSQDGFNCAGFHTALNNQRFSLKCATTQLRFAGDGHAPEAGIQPRDA